MKKIKAKKSQNNIQKKFNKNQSQKSENRNSLLLRYINYRRFIEICEGIFYDFN